MTIAQKVYTGLVLAFGVLMLLVLGFFWLVLLPKSSNPQITKLIMFLFGFHSASILLSTGPSLVKKRLLIIPTIVQGSLLLLTTYGLPLGIWGYCLAAREARRNRGPKRTGLSLRKEGAHGVMRYAIFIVSLLSCVLIVATFLVGHHQLGKVGEKAFYQGGSGAANTAGLIAGIGIVCLGIPGIFLGGVSLFLIGLCLLKPLRHSYRSVFVWASVPLLIPAFILVYILVTTG